MAEFVRIETANFHWEKSRYRCILITLKQNQFAQEVDAVAMTLGYDTNEDVLRILLDGMAELPRCMAECFRTETANFRREKSRDMCMVLTLKCNQFAQEVNAAAVTLGYEDVLLRILLDGMVELT